MKLLMITGDRSLAQGKKGAFWNTISEFHKHWDRIDIITPSIPEHRYDMIVFGNVYIHPSPLPLIFQPLWIWWKGKQIFREQCTDLMTVHSYPPFYNDKGAWFLSRATHVPFVTEVHHIVGSPRAANSKERFYRWLSRWIIPFYAKRARAVRVVNKHQAPDFLIRAGVAREKITYIPSIYLDFNVFRPMDIPKKYDLIFVGRLASNKGAILFLEIVRRTGLKALIVGDGPLRKKLETKSSKLETPAVFHGFAKDQYEVAELINGARLLVMVSDNEGGPRVVPEAMACGVPVLATPVGIVPDVLPPEAIEEWDDEALAQKAENILSDEQLYRRLRESGLHLAQQFERRAAIRNYAETLKRLIASMNS